MMTIREFSLKHKISRNTLAGRIKRHNIKPVKKIGQTNYYSEKVEELLLQRKKRVFVTQIRRLKIIEYYLMFPRQPKKVTADELGISLGYFLTVLQEWKKNNKFVIIKSKL
jgi:hypothetical protein